MCYGYKRCIFLVCVLEVLYWNTSVVIYTWKAVISSLTFQKASMTSSNESLVKCSMTKLITVSESETQKNFCNICDFYTCQKTHSFCFLEMIASLLRISKSLPLAVPVKLAVDIYTKNFNLRALIFKCIVSSHWCLFSTIGTLKSKKEQRRNF